MGSERMFGSERKFRSSGGETIFIDDLPEKMDQRWLRNIFSKIGKILNVFISRRRRMGSNTRFGFVTFSSHRGVALAIARFNGLWCLDRRLHVSKARSNFKKVTSRRDSCPTWRRVEPVDLCPVWKRIEPTDNQVGVRRERWAQRCANSCIGDEEEPTLQGNLVEAKIIETEWC
ncbi:hypothetical protein U1Q18_028992 [Sarracenia purpurea var. burkii]